MPHLLFTGIANAVVAFYIFMLVPNTCCAFGLGRPVRPTASRCRAMSNSLSTGAAILACNHVSFVDAMLLMVKPARAHLLPWTTAFPRAGAGLVVPSGQGDPGSRRKGRPEDLRSQRFDRVAQVLREGDLLAIFPKAVSRATGSCRRSGGIMKIIERAKAEVSEAPVVPMAPTNLWACSSSCIEQGGAYGAPCSVAAYSAAGLEREGTAAASDAARAVA